MPIEPMILHPSKLQAATLVLVSGPLIAIGSFLIHARNGFGWVVVAFFGLLFLVGLVMAVPGSTFLKISQDGFEMRTLFRSHFIRWSDVREFGVASLESRKMVAFNYSENHKARAALRKINSRLVGFEGALPDAYGLGHEELATLLNECLIKYHEGTSG
jgi:hypothetical protein